MSAPVLRARAFAAQHQHDFASAIALLDQAIALEPRDGDAHLARAQVGIVLGQLAAARADCIALTLGIDASRGLLCIAALSFRRGEFAHAAKLLDRWLQQSPPADPLRRHALVLRAETASRAGDADATRRFRDALALAPGDVRTLAAYARHLRVRGQERAALALLDTAPESDALQLQRALAAQAASSPRAPALIAAQGRRYRLAHALGSTPELRDEAEFLLTLRGNAAGALALAQQNFAEQRDYEDVDILLRSAAGARRPQALRALREWAARERIALPQTPALEAP